jgi:hypothetical protein
MPASDTCYTSGEPGALSKLIGRIKVLDVLAFIVPLTQFVEIQVVGRLFLPDLLLACMLPMLLLRFGRRLGARLPLIFIIFATLWLFGQIATDMVRETAFRDYARGWAKIGFTLINFCSLYLLLYGHPNRLILYAAGLATGGMIAYFLNPNYYAADYPWKFGFGAPITWIFILSAVAAIERRRTGPYIACGILAGAAALNVFMGFRSLGGVCFLAACYLFAQARWGHRLASLRTRSVRIFLIGALVMAAGVVVIQLYDYTAKSGMLGEEDRKKYQIQVSGTYGLILGGRGEILVSGRAILESPLIGHGSWAKDFEYSSLLNELRRQAGYITGTDDEEGLIPTHSHLLGAWVEAGFLGAIFWTWVLSLPTRVLFRMSGMKDYLTPLTVFVAFLLIWDVFFSPYGAESRFLAPYYVVVMMTCLNNYRGNFITVTSL